MTAYRPTAIILAALRAALPTERIYSVHPADYANHAPCVVISVIESVRMTSPIDSRFAFRPAVQVDAIAADPADAELLAMLIHDTLRALWLSGWHAANVGAIGRVTPLAFPSVVTDEDLPHGLSLFRARYSIIVRPPH